MSRSIRKLALLVLLGALLTTGAAGCGQPGGKTQSINEKQFVFLQNPSSDTKR